MRRIIKIFVVLITLVVVSIVAAIVIIPILYPADRLVGIAVELTRERTGRELTVGGKPELSVFPRFRLSLSDLRLSNRPGARFSNMAAVDAVHIEFSVLSAIMGKVRVDRFVLERPRLALEIGRDGRSNWTFDAQPGEASIPSQGDASGSADHRSNDADIANFPAISLGDVRIIEGSLDFVDHGKKIHEQIDLVNLKLSLDDADSVFRAEGGARWHGEIMSVSVQTGELAALKQRKSLALRIDASSKPLKLSFSGNVGLNPPGFSAHGRVGVETLSVRKLARWARLDLPDGSGLGPFSLSGDIDYAGSKLGVRNGKLTLDTTTAGGDLQLNLAQSRPSIVAKLRTGIVDLRPYSTLHQEPKTTAPATSAKPAQGQNATATKWSKAPIKLAGLQAFDLDMKLSVAGILVDQLEIGKGNISLKIKQGRLHADLDRLDLYGGNISSSVKLDGVAAPARWQVGVTVSGVQMPPLLRGLDVTELVTSGSVTKLNGDLVSQGQSPHDLVSALRGSVRFALGNITVKGQNVVTSLAGIIAGLSNASSPLAVIQQARSKTAQISQAHASFAVNKGIMVTNDAAISGLRLNVAATGSLALPDKSMNLLITPAIIEDDGETKHLVRIKVTGPWSNPSIRPLLGGVAGSVVKKTAQDLLQGVLGKKKTGSADGSKQVPGAAALKDVLRNVGDLFGIGGR